MIDVLTKNLREDIFHNFKKIKIYFYDMILLSILINQISNWCNCLQCGCINFFTLEQSLVSRFMYVMMEGIL